MCGTYLASMKLAPRRGGYLGTYYGAAEIGATRSSLKKFSPLHPISKLNDAFSASMNTQKDLLDFLTQRGFVKCKNTWGGSENRCDWYAAKRYGVEHLCETNSNKHGIQIVVWPLEYHFPQLENPCRSVEIEITGEANGIWYKLCTYSIPWAEAVERFDAITESLVVAWDSIPRKEK